MVFIGPGSEWFWTAFSGLLVAATLIVIYGQLRDQRSAALHEQSAAWDREWFTDDLAVSRLAFLVQLESWPLKDGLPRSFSEIGAFFERLGYLVERRHLREDDVWNSQRDGVGWWWAVVEPYLRRTREIEGIPTLYEGFEKLEGVMRRLDRKHNGTQTNYNPTLEDRRAQIHRETARLRLRAQARNGVFPSLPAEDEAESTRKVAS